MIKNMALFSVRHNYVKPSNIIIRGQMTDPIINSIYNCFLNLQNELCEFDERRRIGESHYYDLERNVFAFFLNKKLSDYRGNVILGYMEGSYAWYEKLDLIEFCIEYLVRVNSVVHNLPPLYNFILNLNSEFKRHNFAYRIINCQIIEITSEEEITSIETALTENNDKVRFHLSEALKLYSKRPTGDFRNSIKESISAVEVYCREKTGKNTLGESLNSLETKGGIILPPQLKTAFGKLYDYTNQKDTGIRHALMESTNTYVPRAEEALFMLVSCSAFINYLNKKS